ncbi:DUF3987 domain-containing protein [Synechococcus sp. CCY9201]|uniref:DUF3987 domain-containing protein n=1 Tax=Synechococcus sp. CCY9201 TaxID=174697 RepID=UPI002B208840|nr:DUF3987 domain-containing protein [Synechococcus sp. CCY9201]MEA5473252.1 DUF3987 domain-containing protein [Synechococcus sp. CCY9201]
MTYDDDLTQPIDTASPLKATRDAAQADGAGVAMAEAMATMRGWVGKISGSQLQADLTELAEANGLPISALRSIWQELEAEQETAHRLEAEAAALAAEADRQEIGRALTLDYLLPASVAEAIETRSRYLPVSGPSAALPFLAAVASLAKLGTMVTGSAASNLVVPVNLYACLVGASGTMKSPAGRLLVRHPREPLEASLWEQHEGRMEAWHRECQGLKRNECPDPPQLAQLLTNDHTGEALANTLAINERQGLPLLIYRDELKALFGSLNAYRGGKGGDHEQLLELFDGGGMTSLRVAGQGRQYRRSAVSIYGSTQTEVLRRLVANGDDSGLWARFLFAPVPAVAVALPEDDDDREALEAADHLQRVASQVHALKPRPYRLSDDARAAFRQYHHGKQVLALESTLPAHAALHGKAAGKALRVAGVLHLLAIATREAPDTGPIGAATLERATTLVDCLDAFALGIHAEAAGGGATPLLQLVHRIAQAARTDFSPGEVRMKLSKQQRKEADLASITAAMQALRRAGYGEVQEGNRGAIRYRATGELP